MQTILLYLLVMAIVVGVVFAVVWFVFGRGEDLPPLEPGTTLTTLPRSDVRGSDVAALRFAQTFRGYKPVEVDWALARLAEEIDGLRATVIELRERPDVRETTPAETPAGTPAADPGMPPED